MLSFKLQTEDKHNSKSANSQMLVTIIAAPKNKSPFVQATSEDKDMKLRQGHNLVFQGRDGKVLES